MTAVQDPQVTGPDRRRLRDRVEAEAYVASVCFKHGPPKLHGVELEWIVHHEEDPRRPLDARRLVAALGPHAPRTLTPDSPQRPLPSGSPLTVEPGGQVEISALPQPSLAELFDAVHADPVHVAQQLVGGVPTSAVPGGPDMGVRVEEFKPVQHPSRRPP